MPTDNQFLEQIRDQTRTTAQRVGDVDQKLGEINSKLTSINNNLSKLVKLAENPPWSEEQKWAALFNERTP